ncbi:hypothetical protein WJX73_003325 [Symbiochloris irregularis]|uniref:Calcineurin-like phosphoesterase domain-containing protein n=1 Tax=Symbiochloris irregularis TaxID=706552 RepID=A0AAW1PM05_9CHLO
MATSTSVWSEAAGAIRLLVCGDVHYKWGPKDHRALELLKPHAVLFVGDFGEEATSIVEDISCLPQPKATILGNHDAWHSLYPTGQPQYSGALKQLKDLGQDHLAWSAKRFKGKDHPPFTIMGARPFSQGGDWANDFIQDPATGEAVREDYGDWDLQEALSDPQTRQRVCAVVFGHMHHRLHPIAGGGLRNMAALDPTTATVYLNAAVVPRQDTVEDFDGGLVQAQHFLAIEIRDDIVVMATHCDYTIESLFGSFAIQIY